MHRLPSRGRGAEVPASVALQPPLTTTSERRRSAVGGTEKGKKQCWRGRCSTRDSPSAAVARTGRPATPNMRAPLRRHAAHEGRLCVAPCFLVLGGNCLQWTEDGCHRILPPSAPTGLRVTPIAPPDLLASTPPLEVAPEHHLRRTSPNKMPRPRVCLLADPFPKGSFRARFLAALVSAGPHSCNGLPRGAAHAGHDVEPATRQDGTRPAPLPS